MTEILTSAQMRAIEAAAIESGSVSGVQLMERAGAGVVDALLGEWPDLRLLPQSAVVLCGPGNNGGDGFVIARMLSETGWSVRVVFGGTADRLPPDALTNYNRWCAIGGVVGIRDVSQTAEQPPVVIIDALFGTGVTRPLGPEYQHLLRIAAAWRRENPGTSGSRVVAVDIPSGLCADSGADLGAGLPADLTVTFHCAKTGHYLTRKPGWCGRLVTVDIGLPAQTSADRVGLVTPAIADLSRHGTHKFSYGHAVVVAGGPGQGGAARLAARAALRVGAGLVSLACSPASIPENAARLDAVMLQPVPNAAGFSRLLSDRRINALCLGPGMGLGDRQAAMVRVALNSGRRLVLDADALTLIARDPALFRALHAGCVLTPHGGEFARLFPDIADQYAGGPENGSRFSKADATRAAAQRAGCVVLYKGPDTVIADADGRCSLNAAMYQRSAPWLATAGAGDVLAGLITGLMARGFCPMTAAETGAWLHVEAARVFGPGLIAEDLPDALPSVFRSLGV